MTESRSGSTFERLLRSGRFVITAELSPPDSANPEDVYSLVRKLENYVDVFNVTDGAGANCHMSSFGACMLLSQAGHEVILQMTCRDRNRIALQGDLLGASALGIKNVLCLTGDDVVIGDHPQAKRVFDLDSIQLIRTAKTMRDENVYLSGRKLSSSPGLFLGASVNPFAEPFDFRPINLAKKIQAGAEFFQTQFCFDIDRFRSFMGRIGDMGLLEKCFIIPGVGPLRSERSARFLCTRVPGVFIPDTILTRMHTTPLNRQGEEGRRICIELIQQVMEIKGVAGIHMMAYKQEEAVGEIFEKVGLIPRPANRLLN
jgi:methylenetetrahydrofolate reductase (NADPH)